MEGHSITSTKGLPAESSLNSENKAPCHYRIVLLHLFSSTHHSNQTPHQLPINPPSLLPQVKLKWSVRHVPAEVTLNHSVKWLTRVMSRQLLLHVAYAYLIHLAHTDDVHSLMMCTNCRKRYCGWGSDHALDVSSKPGCGVWLNKFRVYNSMVR